jgi:hypothetical protein
MSPRLCMSGAFVLGAIVFVFESPALVPGVRVFPKDFKLRLWCVRGGQGDHP